MPDLRRADARHGDRAVLLDVLDAAPVRRADVRLLRRRPLQHRPEELRSRRRLAAGGVAGARRSITCCRTSRPSTSRPRSCTDCRSPPATSRRPRATGSPTSPRCCWRRRSDLLAAGLQVTRRAPPPGRGWRWRSRRFGAGDRRCRSVRDRAYPRERAAEPGAALRPVAGRRSRRIALSFDALAADVYWIRAIQHYGGDRLSRDGRRQIRAAVSAARPDDDARSVLHDRLPVRRDLPERSAIRAGRAGRIWRLRCCEKGHRRAADEVAVLPRHRLRPLLAAARLRRPRRSGSGGGGAARCAQLAGAAGRVDADRAAAIAPRRGSCGSRLLQSEERWLREMAERSAAPAGRARSDRPAAVR